MQKQVEAWRETELSNVAAKMIIYEAFIESELDVPKHLARRVHDFYFNPQYDEFKARERSGACRMHSRRPLRNSSRFRSSRRRRS